MKKVFLTAVAVVALGSFGNASTPTNLELESQILFYDCMDVHFDAYIYVIERGGSQTQALRNAAIAYEACVSEE